MKVLMIGWELPPYNSGGLGVACYHLARQLSRKGVRVSFVLPQRRDFDIPDFRLLFAEAVAERDPLFPVYTSLLAAKNKEDLSLDLLDQVFAYARKIIRIAQKENFNLIHAHDWLSFPAGVAAAAVSGKPLIAHVHITEFDKSGGQSVDQRIFEIEKEGMEKAKKLIAVSQMTKKKITDFYQIKPEKITVIHNGVVREEWQGHYPLLKMKTKDKKIVLFLGRLTLQKGPDWLLQAAKKVLAVNPHVLFVFVGAGEMMPQLIQQAAEMGIAEDVLFAGFLRGEETIRIFKAADLYVLPSVSDPFGITVLEAMAAGTPVLISRQAGVGEALNHVLRVDFWDTKEMAAKILAALKYQPLSRALKENGLVETQRFSWENAAEKCLGVYRELVT